jgi:hypothetical protein
MELGSYFLFLQEQIKDIIIIKHKSSLWIRPEVEMHACKKAAYQWRW